jgi:hypothetical protein
VCILGEILAVSFQRETIRDAATVTDFTKRGSVLIALEAIVVANLAQIDRVLAQALRKQDRARIERLRNNLLAPKRITYHDTDIAGAGHLRQSIDDEGSGRQLAAGDQLVVDENIYR